MIGVDDKCKTKRYNKALNVFVMFLLFTGIMYFIISLECFLINQECHDMRYDLKTGAMNDSYATYRLNIMNEDLDDLEELMFKPWAYPIWKLNSIIIGNNPYVAPPPIHNICTDSSAPTAYGYCSNFPHDCNEYFW